MGMHEIAAPNQQNPKEYSEYHDRKAKERNYEVGSKVLVHALSQMEIVQTNWQIDGMDHTSYLANFPQ